MFDVTEKHARLKIRPVRPEDGEMWKRMRCELWPDGRDDHGREIASFFAGTAVEPEAVLIAESVDGRLVAVAELSVRTSIPSLLGQRVGYVEGLYVEPDVRHRSIARSLLIASRGWARQQGCTGFASDRTGQMVIDRSYTRK
jgi:aminoglycoside 6'-N-acetyltransferase I